MAVPIIVGTVIGGLIQAAGTLVGRVLVSLGIGYASFTGIDAGIEWAKTFLVGKLGALPPVAVGIASTMQVGTCISILTSAVLARLVLAGLQNGTLKRFVLS
jgi:hypothetical protein